MAQNKEPLKAEELTGLFIYHDHRKVVYKDFLMKDGYIITNRDAEKYTRYSLRLPLAIMAACLVMLFKSSFVLAIAAFVAVEVVMYSMFRFKFLPTLPVIENYEHPKKDNPIESQAKKVTKKRCLVFICLSLILIGLCIFQMTAYTGQMFAFNCVVAVAALALAIFYSLVLSKIISNEKAAKKEGNNKDAK